MFKVCFCGRPNVGKSSLFNRLVGKRQSLVLDEPGVTRDIIKNSCEITPGVVIELADLAGLESFGDVKPLDDNQTKLRKLSEQMALEYLKTVDLVLFVVDMRVPLTPNDIELSRLVRRFGKATIIVGSKAEGRVGDQVDFYAAELGFSESVATSAEHNEGITALKEAIIQAQGGLPQPIVASMEDVEPEATTDELVPTTAPTKADRGLVAQYPLRFGVYGRPNVGKSTLVNTILGEHRMITSPIAGTTVDAIDTDFTHNGKFYRIIDTAGIRKKSKTEQGVEVLSVVQALKSVSQLDIALFLIDGFEGVTDQDEKVAGELIKAGKPVVIVVNKWDLCKTKREEYAVRLRETLGFLDYAPVLFISAQRNEGLEHLWDLFDEILSQRETIAQTADLNRYVKSLEGHHYASGLKLYYASQTAKYPPTITVMVNDPKKVRFSFERFLKNSLRQKYGWLASPIKIQFKKRMRSESNYTRQSYGID